MNEAIKVFQDRMTDTQTSCVDIAKGIRGASQMKWMFGGNGKPGKFDHQGLHIEFDRSEAADNYFDAIESSASDESGQRNRQELAIAKMQSDFLSGMERDFHQRRRSRIRMLAHESTARHHAGSSKGVIQANLMEYLQVQKQRVAGLQGDGRGD